LGFHLSPQLYTKLNRLVLLRSKGAISKFT
jgi:hypothetical protein